MKDAVLMELVERWQADAVEPELMEGSQWAEIENAVAKGERQAKRECADTLRMLVALLGEKTTVVSGRLGLQAKNDRVLSSRDTERKG